MRAAHILVMAKSPRPGRVKTRLCPPLSPPEAAELAEAALADTLEAVCRAGAGRRLVALDGPPGDWLPPGFVVIPQQGTGLDERLARAWEAAGGPGLQIGMDTPQVTPGLLDGCLGALLDNDTHSVLGAAPDGGWWAIGLRRPDPRVFLGLPMSTSRTWAAQRRRLRRLGRDPLPLPVLRDVDVMSDAEEVAAAIPDSRFAAVFRSLRAPAR